MKTVIMGMAIMTAVTFAAAALSVSAAAGTDAARVAQWEAARAGVLAWFESNFYGRAPQGVRLRAHGAYAHSCDV